MTKLERKQLDVLWAKIENLIIIIDPQLSFKEVIKEEYKNQGVFTVIDSWLDYLQTAVKYKLLDLEAAGRERDSFLKLLNEVQE